MALPDGFLDDLKSRLSLGQVAGRKLTWDKHKSNPAKGDLWSPCPFHSEKTPSFHVEDRKGFYYCFGCGAKGDVVSFVRETENVSFMEAIEILAREAGMPMPKQDPQAAQKAQKRAGLHDVMDLAVSFYRMQLNAGHAAEARDYISGRGLGAEDLARFEIGFAPATRTALLDHLKSKDIPVAQMDEAGLIIIPDSGTPFDRFRDRIMFPIRDVRGKPIAFGGRAMSSETKAKYLNSSATPLFDKGRTLYNHAPAREAAGKTGSLIVAEGYMDVIALATHGFAHTVAPLGTAITNEQLDLMWRIADEPVIALDGDTAGLRAAMRLIDVALPVLQAGKSLRFALMPDGMDPDDVLKSSGTAAMQKLLDEAMPMVALLWQRETDGKVFDSPERRAALDASLRKLINEIKDPSIREHYHADFRRRRNDLFRGAPAPAQNAAFRPFTPGAKRPPRPTTGAKASLLARADGTGSEARIREATILSSCIRRPTLIEQAESDLETLTFINDDLGRIRDAMLATFAALAARKDDESSLSGESFAAALADRIETTQIEALSRTARRRTPRPHAGFDAEKTDAQLLLADISLHRAILGKIRETQDAELEIVGVVENDEGVTWRLSQAQAAQDHAARLGFDDTADDSDEDRENSRFLQQLIDDQSWIKKKS